MYAFTLKTDQRISPIVSDNILIYSFLFFSFLNPKEMYLY